LVPRALQMARCTTSWESQRHSLPSSVPGTRLAFAVLDRKLSSGTCATDLSISPRQRTGQVLLHRNSNRRPPILSAEAVTFYAIGGAAGYRVLGELGASLAKSYGGGEQLGAQDQRDQVRAVAVHGTRAVAACFAVRRWRVIFRSSHFSLLWMGQQIQLNIPGNVRRTLASINSCHRWEPRRRKHFLGWVSTTPSPWAVVRAIAHLHKHL